MALQRFVGDLLRSLRLHAFVFVFRILLRWRTAAHIRRDSAVLPLAEAGVRQKRVQVPSRDPGRTILAHLYLPLRPDEDGRPLPVLVNWHGSGFVFPLHGTDAYFCTRMARDCGLAVLDADYRKAPEHPCPAAIDDAEDALRWVASSASSSPSNFNLDSSRVAVSGFSAGGHIAAAAASHLRKKLEKDLDIAMLLSIYAPSPSLRAHAPWILRMFADAYAPDPASRTDPAVSPGFADAEAYPQTTAFLTCEGDNLRWEIEALVARLREVEGGPEGNEGDGGKKREVHYKMLEGVCHAFDKGIKEDGGGSLPWTRREEAYAWAAELLKDALHPKQWDGARIAR
ncbi:Alpha/Beta hydrolase protein [Apiospora aurea]|uniref:Alpha/Beta hydrolase protein n=1 Tax=Apiospora aurea TaxID=335848 RepID=A0ABR1QG41_9PEZI